MLVNLESFTFLGQKEAKIKKSQQHLAARKERRREVKSPLGRGKKKKTYKKEKVWRETRLESVKKKRESNALLFFYVLSHDAFDCRRRGESFEFDARINILRRKTKRCLFNKAEEKSFTRYFATRQNNSCEKLKGSMLFVEYAISFVKSIDFFFF